MVQKIKSFSFVTKKIMQCSFFSSMKTTPDAITEEESDTEMFLKKSPDKVIFIDLSLSVTTCEVRCNRNMIVTVLLQRCRYTTIRTTIDLCTPGVQRSMVLQKLIRLGFNKLLCFYITFAFALN